MEESVILHRLESRLAGQKTQAIEELIGIVKDSGKLHFNNKLSLFSSFKRILQDEDLQLRTKCTKLICDVLPKLGTDMDTCMSFVMPNILSNMAANNLVLKRESIKLIRCFSEITSDKNALVRSVIWEGIDSKDPATSREVILSLDKLIFNILQTEDSYNIVTALCKRHFVEENKKVKKAIKDSFISIAGIISSNRMEELITQLPSSAITSGRELLQIHKQTQKPKVTSYKSNTKLEVDSAISLEGKLLWDLIPDSTLTKLHGDDVVDQLKAIAELESAIRRVTSPSDFLICIDEICEAIIKVIPINNFRVFKASTVLVSAFVEVFREVLGDCVYPLTRALCHKIGDNKIAVREGTMKCLTQLMRVCGPRPVLDVVLVNLRDRNPRVREEAINVVIKTMLTFPIADLNVTTVAEYLVSALADHRQRVVNTALEAITVLKDRISTREVGIIYRAVEKIDTPDKRYLNAIKDRLDKGTMSTLNDVGLVTHGEGCFTRNGTTLTGGSTSRMSNQSVSVPTTSQERMISKDGTACPPTPLSLPRRYYSAGRNRLPWERPSRQNTLLVNNQGTEEQFTSPRGGDRSHVFIKGGGGRSDGGSYAQMHLKKIQKESSGPEDSPSNHTSAPRSNTLGSLKKYFPSVKGSPDPKRSWPTTKTKDEEVLSNGSAPPQKSNSFANDSYGVQTSSMYANYRVNSGESSGVGTLTNNTPNGSASNPPRQNHYSPATTLNDSGIFEEHSFVNSKAPKHSTSLPVLKRTRTISLSRNFTAANKDPVSQSRDSKCDPVLRSILKKQRGDEANSVDWELTFGRSNTFAGRQGLARKKLRRKKIVKHVSIHNIPSISSVPSVVSTTSQDSTSTRKGTSERPPIHSKSKDKKAGRGKSKQKDKRYYPKSQQNNQDPSTQRIISPIPSTEESSASILKSNKSSPSITKSSKTSSPSNSKSNKLIPDNPQFAADAAPLPDIPRVKTKNTTKTDRIRQGKKSARYKAKNNQTKSETEIDGGTTYRVIPISDMNRLAQERSEGTTGTTGTERSTPVTTEEHRTSPQAPEESETSSNKDSRSAARRDIKQDEEGRRAEEERLELAKWEKIRMEELAKEEKRRSTMRAQLQRENEVAEQYHKEEGMRIDSYHIGNGYVELNLAKKKLKQAAEDSRKPRPKLIKARTRTESISNEPDKNIDIVGKGLSSHHIDSEGGIKEQMKDKPKMSEEKQPLRAPSGVYGQRVHPSRSPDEVDGSLSDNSDNSEEDSSDKEEQTNREGHPIGSGLSAATRMRFEKKRAQLVERQSAEQRLPHEEPEYEVEREQKPRPSPRAPRAQFGKPVSAPVESRLNVSDGGVKRSPSKPQVRAGSLRPHDTSDKDPVDEKEDVPLLNPESAAAEAVKNLKIGGEEWNFKVQGLHVLRRLARHHPDVFQSDILNYIRLTCAEVLNLRSQVARLAIQIIGDYFTLLKTAMDADLERTCECLLIKTGELNQFIRNDIGATLSKMVDNATPSRVLVSLINHGTSHKSANVRAISGACFKDIVSRMGVNKCLNKEFAPKFITAVDKLSHDGNQEARYYGRLVLSWCMELSNFDSLCQRHLPANAARNLKDLCDKIKNKGVGNLPQSADRTSGRYRSQPVSRAQSNLSATYPTNRSRKPSCHNEADHPDSLHTSLETNSPRTARRPGPRRDLRETVHSDRMPQSLYKNLNSSNWQDRYTGIAELLDLSIKQPAEVRQCIVRISDAFTPRLKDPNSKVNLYALQCLLRMLPHLETSLDQVLTPFTEQLVPNLASQRANIVTLTSQILDGFKVHVDNPQLVCEYCRIIKSQNNPRIKPIILDKISDMVRQVHEVRPKLVEQMTVPIIVEHSECLVQTNGANNLGSYVGRLACLVYQCMGNKLLTEINRIKPATVGTIREYLVANT